MVGTKPNRFFVRSADTEVYRKNVLMVRKFEETSFWTIERLGILRPYPHIDEVLVFNFASTPIVTRSRASAMRVGMLCRVNPSAGLALRWTKGLPDDLTGAIEFARRRQMDEAVSAAGAQLKSPN